MIDLSGQDTEIVPARKLTATAVAVYAAMGDDFVTRALTHLPIGFDGIAGDFHAGATRLSGSREPWYPRGTEIRNERQLSLVAADELALIAQRMNLEKILPEWVGANVVVEGIPQLSMLPAGTMMFFASGVTLKVDGQNHPCRLAGRSVARHAGLEDIEAGSLAFPRAARRLRGLVAWVEKPGTVAPGEAISVKVPEQWIYRA